MDDFGPIHTNPGLSLTVPKTEHVGCPWQPTHPPFVPLFETDFHAHFRSPTHQNTIYLINHHTTPKTVPKTATDCTNGSQKFQHFGSKIWDRSNGHSRPQSNTNINKALKSRIKQVGLNPYLMEFVETP